MPVESIKGFERLGKLLNAMQKTRSLRKDFRVLNEVKKLIETILKIKTKP